MEKHFLYHKTLSAILLAGMMCSAPFSEIKAEEARRADLEQQQTVKVTGKVLDANGEPVIGASVTVKKNKSLGTITDFDGNFTLSVPAQSLLVISYIGYAQQEIKAVPDKILKITLKEDSEMMDEVVIVGFGTQKKVNLTGAVGVTDAKSLESRPVVSATQALQGLVPGLQITQNNGSMESDPSISIRGKGTIGKGSDSAPLVLIDGMEGDLNTVNPQDIESVSVLKDAASSSIYGSRAPFGVILVTTKKGKQGKTSVNYNNSFRWATPIRLASTMDSYTFATYFNDGCKNTPGRGEFFDKDHLQRIKDYQTGKLTTSIPDGGNGYWADGYQAGNANVDWYDTVYKDVTFSQEHNINATGGAENLNYYLSFNYLDQGGLMEWGNEDKKRYNATAKINVKLTDWIQASYTMRWTRQNYVRPARLVNSLYSDIGRQGWPTLPLYDPNGYLYSSPSPALGLATGGDDNKETDDNYHQLALIVEPVKNWITHIEFNYHVNSATRHWDSQLTYNHDVAGNPYLYGNTESNIHEDYYKENYLNLNVYSEYSKTWAEQHNFHLMAGFQTENLKQTQYGLQRSGILIPGLPELDLSTGLDTNGNPVTPSTNGSRHEWATAGFFGRLNYDWKGRYLLEANLRYDGTSRFRKDNRWVLLPSVSVGWNIAHEAFWESFKDKVNTLKLRLSYGILGNQNTGNWYQTYRTMTVNSSDGGWLQDGVKPNIAKFPGLVSTVLTWEKIHTWNLGVDWGMFNNRLTGSFDYFIRDTKDMVGPAPELPATLGTDVPNTNNTDLRTQGWEFQLAWNDRLNNGLGYGAKFLLSDSRRKITRYPNNPTLSLDSYIEGRYTGDIWGYETIGIAKSKEEMENHLASLPNGGQNALGSSWDAGDIMYKDLNGDGKIDSGSGTLNNPGDRKVIGNSVPRFQFSFDLSADYKGLDIRAFFQGVMKRDYFQGSSYFWGIGGNDFWHSQGLDQHVDYFRAEASNDLPANPDAYYPRPVFDSGKNFECQTRYLLNAAYIRLKNLQVGYTLPASMTSKIGVSKLRIYFSGENLWTGTSLSSLFDPETVDGGEGGCVYPLSRTYSCGLSLTF